MTSRPTDYSVGSQRFTVLLLKILTLKNSIFGTMAASKRAWIFCSLQMSFGDTTSLDTTIKLSERFTPNGSIRGRLMTLSSSLGSSSQTFWTVTSAPVQQTCLQTCMAVIHWKRGDIVSTFTNQSLAKVLMGIGRFTPRRWVCIANRTLLFPVQLLRCLFPSLKFIRLALTPSTVLPTSWPGKRPRVSPSM